MTIFSATSLAWAFLLGMCLKESELCYLHEDAEVMFPSKREVLTALGGLSFETFALSQLGLPPGTSLALRVLWKNVTVDHSEPSPEAASLTYTQREPANPGEVSIHLGRELLPLIDPREGAKLLEMVTDLRKQFLAEFGFYFEGVRFHQCLKIEPRGYRISVGEEIVARGEVPTDKMLALGSLQDLNRFEAEIIQEPSYKIPACWIDPGQVSGRSRCAFFAPRQVIATHILETLRRNASRLLTPEVTRQIIAGYEKINFGLPFTDGTQLGHFNRVLARLVEDRISLSPMPAILENYLRLRDQLSCETEIADEIRVVLSRFICDRYSSDSGVLHVLVPEPSVVTALRSGLKVEQRKSLRRELLMRFEILFEGGLQPLLITERDVRRKLAQIAGEADLHAVVLCWDDVYPGVGVNVLGALELGQEGS